MRRSNNISVVAGSACLWAWGFLAFLSPVLIPDGGSTLASSGLEYGFFASQAVAALLACVVVLVSRRRSIVVPTPLFLVAALVLAISTPLIAWALTEDLLWLVILCCVLDGIADPLLGVAWGTRYSLGSKSMRLLVVLSFLVCYLIYLVVANIPAPVSLVITCALPLVSWALWIRDATLRHELSSEVFPVRTEGGEELALGEVAAGSREAGLLPWRDIGVFLAAALIGNTLTSVMMGWGYEGADAIYFGGVIVCACIATMALVPLAYNHEVLTVGSVYRISITFTAVGLVGILVFGSDALVVCGALVQGCALFLQVLMILVVTQSTQEQGLSPLFSFSVAQGLIAAMVFLGNVVGKTIFALAGSDELVLDVMCGIGLLALFFMLASIAGSSGDPSGEEAGAAEGLATKADEPVPVALGEDAAGSAAALEAREGTAAPAVGIFGSPCAPGEPRPTDSAAEASGEAPRAAGGSSHDVSAAGPNSAAEAAPLPVSPNPAPEPAPAPQSAAAAACPVPVAAIAVPVEELAFAEEHASPAPAEAAPVEAFPATVVAQSDIDASVQERIARFSQQYGLTKRETEVFGYLSRGRSLPYIADVLFVTTGTVKTHTMHIYRKLGVNSRQELLDMFDAYE